MVKITNILRPISYVFGRGEPRPCKSTHFLISKFLLRGILMACVLRRDSECYRMVPTSY